MRPIALQLWSVHEECARDFAGTVSTVARLGYAGVELAGYGNVSVSDAKAAIDAAGLAVVGMHVRPEALTDRLDTVIDDAVILGTRDVICAWWPPTRLVSASACEELGGRLDRIGAVLRAHGLRFSYHNHDGEMRCVDGRLALEWMLGAAAPRNLSAELDVYWAHHAGVSPAAMLHQLGARCPLVHLKDEHEIGGGPVDFESVFAAIDTVGAAEWLIVESDRPTVSALAGAQSSLEQLRRWGRA